MPTPPPAIDIRAAQPRDAATIAAFQQEMARETENKELCATTVRRGVEAVLADASRGRYLMADDGASPCGSLLITAEWSDWRNGWFWWIQSVYVVPTRRSQGVYRSLHEAVRRQAHAAGDCVGLRLYVERENAVARAIYERLGMTETAYRLYEESVGVAL